MDEKIAQPKVNEVFVPDPELVLKSDKPAHVERSTNAKDVVEPEDSQAGRYIPMGEPAEDPVFRGVAENYFDIDPKDFKDSSNEVQFIIDWAVKRLPVPAEGKSHDLTTALGEIQAEIRKIEDSLTPPQEFNTRRFKRVYNFLRNFEKAEAMNRAIRAMLKKGVEPNDIMNYG